jgi:hypothetical protein
LASWGSQLTPGGNDASDATFVGTLSNGYIAMRRRQSIVTNP